MHYPPKSPGMQDFSKTYKSIAYSPVTLKTGALGLSAFM